MTWITSWVAVEGLNQNLIIDAKTQVIMEILRTAGIIGGQDIEEEGKLISDIKKAMIENRSIYTL